MPVSHLKKLINGRASKASNKLILKYESFIHIELTHFGLNTLGSIGIAQCISGLLKVEAGRGDVCHHDGFAVSTEGIFKQSSELAIPIVDIF